MADRTAEAAPGHESQAAVPENHHDAPLTGPDTGHAPLVAMEPDVPRLDAGLHDRMAARMVWRQAFPGAPEQASRARALVRCLLADTAMVDDAEFVAAELVNNALLHTRSGRPGGFFVVEVVRWPVGVRVGVHDLGGAPTPDVTGTQPVRPRLDHAEDGRGLMAVRRLARRVGRDGHPATGHMVWADLGGHAGPAR